jgi:hypothetical protein
MAVKKNTSGGDSRKVSFGRRKGKKAKKSRNRHDRTERNYRKQGRN